MTEHQTDPVVEDRLRDFLAGELRRAEDDYPRLNAVRPRPAARSRRPIAVSLVAVAVLLLAGALVLPRVVGPGIGGPAAITMGDDGLPLSIDGEPVRRLADMDLWATDRDYLVGGTLDLNPVACIPRSARAQLGCGEDWVLVAGPGDYLVAVAVLDAAPAAPGFVRTSGALTVIRVGAPSTIDGVLTVTAIAWRQPTKGPIPDDATPPEGGLTNDALVPDFVSMWDRDGLTIAGYIPKRYVVDGPETTPGGTPSNPPQSLPIPVYGEDLVTLVGHSVPGVGFVALGATETPSPREFSEAPATEAPMTAAPVIVVPSAGPEATAPLPASPDPDAAPVLDCGRIDFFACARAVDLARALDLARPEGEVETTGATRIVVDDTCRPESLCDRKYPFNSFVVFVTAGADTTGWITFEATGLESTMPTAATRFQGNLPAFMANRVAGSSASTFVLRFDVMNRSSQAVVVSVSSDAGADMPGFLPGEQGTVYAPLRTRTSVAGVELLAHPSCRFFAG
ncbi:MAG TPA: hypothetical protein VES19_07115, partial [Candidatus Limnocylindrales bacterium]|nr:hypothetical protein [Candidatus Limnocylindrales bacterium]